MKVLFIDKVDEFLVSGIQDMGFEVVTDFESSYEEVCNKIHDYHGLVIRSRIPIDKELLKCALNLKFVARLGAGMENIDVDAAEEIGIAVLNAPEGNRGAVGEHAIGMLLMLLNNLKRADSEVRNGQWRREPNRGYEIEGKTVGIIGFGQMGSSFAEKLKGFDCEILVYDKYQDVRSDLVRSTDLKGIQQECDIVSLHIPQNPETIGMVDSSFIESFSKPFYLINTARGKVVKTSSLVQGLKSGKILGACLDVLEYESSSFEQMSWSREDPDIDYLLSSDKVILSPHIAGWTHESRRKMASVILEKVAALELL